MGEAFTRIDTQLFAFASLNSIFAFDAVPVDLNGLDVAIFDIGQKLTEVEPPVGSGMTVLNHRPEQHRNTDEDCPENKRFNVRVHNTSAPASWPPARLRFQRLPYM
jgi:hypothetical protein